VRDDRRRRVFDDVAQGRVRIAPAERANHWRREHDVAEQPETYEQDANRLILGRRFDRRLIDEHDRNVVLDRIATMAGLAGEARAVRSHAYWGTADGAHENVEQCRIDRHAATISQLRRAAPEDDRMTWDGWEGAMEPHAIVLAAMIVASPRASASPPVPAPQTPTTAPAQTASGTASDADAYFYFLQGHMLEGGGDVDGAVEAYKKAIAAAPASADIRAELAGVYARAGRTSDAVAAALDALKADEKNPEGNRILGLVQASMAGDTTDASRQTNLTKEAIGHLELALARGSHDLSAELALGRLYLQNGNYPKAVSALRAFLNDRAGYPDAVMMLADALEANHQGADAIGLLSDYIANAPSDLKAAVRLAQLYEGANRWKDAAAEWGTLAAHQGATPALRLRYASALLNSGDLATARTTLDAITKDSPRDVSA